MGLMFVVMTESNFLSDSWSTINTISSPDSSSMLYQEPGHRGGRSSFRRDACLHNTPEEDTGRIDLDHIDPEHTGLEATGCSRWDTGLESSLVAGYNIPSAAPAGNRLAVDSADSGNLVGSCWAGPAVGSPHSLHIPRTRPRGLGVALRRLGDFPLGCYSLVP